MQKIDKNLLDQSLHKAGIYNQVKASDTIGVFLRFIKERFGQEAVNQIKTTYIKNSTLFIKINNSVLAQEIKFSEKEILESLNNEVRIIKFKV